MRGIPHGGIPAMGLILLMEVIPPREPHGKVTDARNAQRMHLTRACSYIPATSMQDVVGFPIDLILYKDLTICPRCTKRLARGEITLHTIAPASYELIPITLGRIGRQISVLSCAVTDPVVVPTTFNASAPSAPPPGRTGQPNDETDPHVSDTEATD